MDDRQARMESPYVEVIRGEVSIEEPSSHTAMKTGRFL
jgi:hypothetical protein